MNRDERDAQLENSLQGVEELACEVGDDAGSFLATFAIDQLLRPTISDIVSPVRRKAVSKATQSTTKAATRIATRKSPSSPDDNTSDNDDTSDDS